MAISNTQETEILKVVAGLFNAAPGGSNLTDLANGVESGMTIPQIADFLAAHPLFTNGVMAGKTTTASQTAVLMGNFGLTPGNSDAASADAQAEAFFTSSIDSGVGFGRIVYQAVTFLSQDNVPAEFADTAALLDNKALVAKVYSENNLGPATDLDALQAVLAGVTSEGPSTEEEAQTYLDEQDDGPTEGPSLMFTQQLDNLMGDSSDNVFQGPVTQNETGSGELANTFETGDAADGVEGRNSLEADLIATGTTGIGLQSPAISAQTDNIQEVYFRAQNVQGFDIASNTTSVATIDAEKMDDVEQWWTQDSRADVRIEDIRSRPDEVTFGMRLTDPAVGYEAYFNPIFMEGDLESESALTLRVQEITDGQDPSDTELENITVHEINFNLAGESFTLDTQEMRDANTWADLETAIADALAAESALADLVVTHEGGGVFVIDDNAGREFEIVPGDALIFGAAADIDVRNRVDVGQLIEEGQTRTDLLVDGVGNGSRGGSVNIAAMSGDRGVEVIDVMVDRTSHLTSLSSVNSPNTVGRSFDTENQLEEVFLTHVTEDTGVSGGSDINEVQTLDFTGGFGDLADGESITISFADGEYTFTNDTGAAILEADIDDAIIADAANAPDAFDIAAGSGGLVELTANNPGDMPDTVVTASDGANVPDEVVIATPTTGETGDSESTNSGTGDFSLGSRTQDSDGVSTTTDDRLQTNGLTDVRVFDATGFASELKLGAELSDNAFDKYLAGAAEPVQFSYLLGDGGSNLNLAVDNDLASDPDFGLEIIGGAMDDRINLVDLETKSTTSIDGGDGQNRVEVTTSTTGEADAGFAEGQRAWNSFENVQTLVVAGGNDTDQNLVTGNMEGLEKVIVASTGAANTTLEQMAMDQDLIISGKNQTLGSGNSNNDQAIGDIVVHNTAAVPDVDQFDIELDNTARVDGVLDVNSISVTGDDSAITTLGLISNGRRDTSNVVSDFAGERVTTLNLTGTQALSANVSMMAALPTTGGDTPPMTITGADLENDLTLAVDSANLTRESLDVLTGTAGDSDALQLYDVLDTASPTVSEFETVQFGAPFHDLDGAQAQGTYDAANTNGVNLYRIDNLSNALIVENLGGQETVHINAWNDNNGSPFDANQDITLSASSRATSNEIDISIETDTATDQYTSSLEINDYRTIGLNFTGENDQVNNFAPTLVLNGFTAGGDDFANYARTLDVTGGQFTGSASSPTNVDELDIGLVPASLTNIDFSAFSGDVTGGFDDVRDDAGAPYAVQEDFSNNTTIGVNSFNFTWDNNIPSSASGNDTITTFRFNEDAYDNTVIWEIDGFNAFNDASVGLSNVSILDLGDLGVDGLADVVIADDGVDTTITSNEGLDFVIQLTGIADANDLSNENFAFA